jgi:hypothetical protein
MLEREEKERERGRGKGRRRGRREEGRARGGRGGEKSLTCFRLVRFVTFPQMLQNMSFVTYSLPHMTVCFFFNIKFDCRFSLFTFQFPIFDFAFRFYFDLFVIVEKAAVKINAKCDDVMREIMHFLKMPITSLQFSQKFIFQFTKTEADEWSLNIAGGSNFSFLLSYTNHFN